MNGLLLINLGTPEQPTKKAVKAYLKEFLSDPLVMDMHPVLRWLLVHGVILPFRSLRSAEAYRKIWTDKGSPLLIHTQDLRNKVADKLKDNYHVEIGMRYGQPSIKTGLDQLIEKGATSIKILPLYPQYAMSTTESSIKEAYRCLKGLTNPLPVEIIPPFYNQPGFIKSFASLARETLQKNSLDHIIFSFHGLPENHLLKTEGRKGFCGHYDTCCKTISKDNKNCYRAQCLATARSLTQELGLEEGGYTISFQSRLGKQTWIPPYTDQEIIKLAQSGKKRIGVLCPSFVTDCLETLEEIGLRGQQTAFENGASNLELIPSLNSHSLWVETIANMVSEA